MRSNLTQGTVITSIRSQKYKNQSCYGIIISARCDIANNKISKIYIHISFNLINRTYNMYAI